MTYRHQRSITDLCTQLYLNHTHYKHFKEIDTFIKEAIYIR